MFSSIKSRGYEPLVTPDTGMTSRSNSSTSAGSAQTHFSSQAVPGPQAHTAPPPQGALATPASANKPLRPRRLPPPPPPLAQYAIGLDSRRKKNLAAQVVELFKRSNGLLMNPHELRVDRGKVKLESTTAAFDAAIFKGIGGSVSEANTEAQFHALKMIWDA